MYIYYNTNARRLKELKNESFAETFLVLLVKKNPEKILNWLMTNEGAYRLDVAMEECTKAGLNLVFEGSKEEIS